MVNTAVFKRAAAAAVANFRIVMALLGNNIFSFANCQQSDLRGMFLNGQDTCLCVDPF